MLDISLDAEAEGTRTRTMSLARRQPRQLPKVLSRTRAWRAQRRIGIRLTSDDAVRALNAEWRGKDKATNVLSFPMAEPDDLDDSADGPELMLGDIVLARDVCVAEAADKAISIEAHASHLLVHGTLHLLGYDHGDDDAASDMEAREVRALARLGIANPYEDAR